MMRRPRVKDADHLAWIRTLACCVCGNPCETEAAHVRFADIKSGKRQTGIGEKPDDGYVVPLCSNHHRSQHNSGERLWWHSVCIDAIVLAQRLYRNSGDTELVPYIFRASRAR